ncbi:hypothetical protein FRC06_004393, partial [Ceratobasidium sp. 370]
MPPHTNTTSTAPLDVLRREATRLARLAEQAPQKQPQLHQLNLPASRYQDEKQLFRTEKWNSSDKLQAHLKLAKGTIRSYQRVMNCWSLLVEHTDQMTIPEFASRTDPTDKRRYHLLGFVNPLNDGARRGSRTLSGFTPLYKRRSHEDLWQMQTKIIVATVGTPYMDTLEFFGCRIPFVIFPSADYKAVLYGVQNPDRYYVPFWNAAMARWAVQHALGNELALKPWKDVDLAAPRPWYFNNWAMRVLRLEHGLAATHDDDPVRPAMLGACRHEQPAARRRAPTTEAEWLAIPEERCDPGDDEEGDSDAGSINDDVERGLPTSAHWDPETKKSTTPRGNVPHPYPEVVRQELERNKRYDQVVAARGRGQGPDTRSRRQVARGATAGSVAGAGRGGEPAPRGSHAATTRGRGSSRQSTRAVQRVSDPDANIRVPAEGQDPRVASRQDDAPGSATGEQRMDVDVPPETGAGEQDADDRMSDTSSQQGSEADAIGEPDRDVETAQDPPPAAVTLPVPTTAVEAQTQPGAVPPPPVAQPSSATLVRPPSAPLPAHSPPQQPSGPSSVSSPQVVEPPLPPNDVSSSGLAPVADQASDPALRTGGNSGPSPGVFAVPVAPPT